LFKVGQKHQEICTMTLALLLTSPLVR